MDGGCYLICFRNFIKSFTFFGHLRLVEKTRKAFVWLAHVCKFSFACYSACYGGLCRSNRHGKCFGQPGSEAGPQIIQHLALDSRPLGFAFCCLSFSGIGSGSCHCSMGSSSVLHPKVLQCRSKGWPAGKPLFHLYQLLDAIQRMVAFAQ